MDVMDSMGVKALLEIRFCEPYPSPKVVLRWFGFVVAIDENEFAVPFASMPVAELLAV